MYTITRARCTTAAGASGARASVLGTSVSPLDENGYYPLSGYAHSLMAVECVDTLKAQRNVFICFFATHVKD